VQFIDIHTHSFSHSDEVVAIKSFSLGEDDLSFFSGSEPIAVGLHPWYAKLESLETQLAELTKVANQKNVWFIGECGLDKLQGESITNQLQIFKAQILLAHQVKKPLVIHCVKAFDELIALKKTFNINVPMLVHGFNKSEQLGNQLQRLGFHLSFGKAILNSDSAAAKLLATLPHFFLETDDADVEIEEIYTAAANLKKCNVEALKARIFADFKNLKYFN
jgi:TatD DNase family protein